ncbi:MAG: hypothetical protein ACK5V3_17265 [Bdellovibrionales bacterium]
MDEDEGYHTESEVIVEGLCLLWLVNGCLQQMGNTAKEETSSRNFIIKIEKALPISQTNKTEERKESSSAEAA